MKVFAASVMAVNHTSKELTHFGVYIEAESIEEAEAMAQRDGFRQMPTSDGWVRHSVNIGEITDNVVSFVFRQKGYV